MPRCARCLLSLLAVVASCLGSGGGSARAEIPPIAAISGEQVDSAAAVRPALPDGVVPGKPLVIGVAGDRGAFAIHAPAENTRAIVYLHGMCGNVRAVESWKDVLATSGTLIGVLGDKPCGAGRYKWGKDLRQLQERVELALRAVKAARGGLLDIEHPILFGYSQGADRAEALAARFPKRYQLVVLGGSPKMPRLQHLGETAAVALFAGELEPSGNMRLGAEVLAAAGKPARFFLLPKAKHGEFGPEGSRVMSEIFTWLLSDTSS